MPHRIPTRFRESIPSLPFLPVQSSAQAPQIQRDNGAWVLAGNHQVTKYIQFGELDIVGFGVLGGKGAGKSGF